MLPVLVSGQARWHNRGVSTRAWWRARGCSTLPRHPLWPSKERCSLQSPTPPRADPIARARARARLAGARTHTCPPARARARTQSAHASTHICTRARAYTHARRSFHFLAQDYAFDTELLELAREWVVRGHMAESALAVSHCLRRAKPPHTRLPPPPLSHCTVAAAARRRKCSWRGASQRTLGWGGVGWGGAGHPRVRGAPRVVRPAR